MTDHACQGTLPKIHEAVCIDTSRVYDSCADKDCLADLSVQFPPKYQDIIDAASQVKCRGVELLHVFLDVERIPFNRGCYSVDITFYFKVSVEFQFCNGKPPVTLKGFTSFTKKCVLYGSDGQVHVYSSEYVPCGDDIQKPKTSSNPRAKIQVAEPVCLGATLKKRCDCCHDACCHPMPKWLCHCFPDCFPDDFCPPMHEKTVAVTIGIFSIVQLERDVQMLIPAYDFCVPKKTCNCDTDDPCDVFRKIHFPVDDFFPPKEKKNGCCEAPTPRCNET